MRPADRERIQVEVASRVVEACLTHAQHKPPGYLEGVVNDTLYHERRRLERADPRSGRTKADQAFYAQLQKRMRHASERDLREVLDEMARHFVVEVVGNFDERVYKLSTTIIPTGLSFLLNAVSPSRLLSFGGMRKDLAQHMVMQGEVEHVRALVRHGTLIVVPTHSSNLDSIIMGYSQYLMGLPPLLYGAGLNLFTNPLISFFMRNLGAYRVDRKKTAGFYKDILKEYATVSLEMGYHNLFFPGGTRSRSGAIERKLKKGLLGTGIAAYVNNLLRDAPNPNLYIVPCTLSYKLVLEAETLIDDYLQEVGKSRYIIDDDEFSRPRKVIHFVNNLINLDSKIVVTWSRPLDVFGNRVDIEGRSFDRRGRQLDTRRYVMRQGQPVHDAQRDMQYTNEVADEVVAAYARDNVLMSTNLVAYALFSLLQQRNPSLDLYRLLRTGGEQASFPMSDLHKETHRVIDALRALPEPPRFGDEIASNDVQEIVGDALKHFAIYHAHPAAVRRGDRVFHEDRNLLYYYSNRVRGYGVGRTPARGVEGRPATVSA